MITSGFRKALFSGEQTRAGRAASCVAVRVAGHAGAGVMQAGVEVMHARARFMHARRVGEVGEFTFLCGTGLKMFTDASIPAGSSQVTYQIRATRPTGAGPWAQYNVNFGVNSGGTMTTSVTESSPTKIAA